MKLDITLKEANDQLCDVYADNLKNAIDDLMVEGITVDYIWQFYGHRFRAEKAAEMKDIRMRMQMYQEISMEYIDLFKYKLLEMGYDEVRIWYPANEANQYFGIILHADV